MTPNDVKIVADNIDDFIEVPDGVTRLRKAVLTLAVSGKLVAEDKNDGSAEQHYKEIQKERLKQVKKLEPVDPVTSIPFEIPSSWKWVRLGEVCEFIYGDGLPRESRNEDGKYNAYGANGPLARTNLLNCETGGVIVGRKGSAGAVTLVSEPFFATDVTYFIPRGQYSAFEVNYLYLLLIALDLPQHSKGIKPGISRKEVYGLPIALPPIPAQKRIVKKAEELMKQLDELEIKKQERDEMRARLARSAMQALGKGESKIAFEQLTELVKTPSDIKELENALLTLAVSGKLTQQNKSDGTSEDLFNQIQSKRVKVKKQVPVGEKDQLFPIPSSWSWVRLEDVFDVRDGTHDSPKYHDNGYPLITSKNLYYGSLDFLNVKYISEDDHKKISERSKVDRDDVLFAMIGSIGNPVIVDTDTEFSIKNVALFKYYDRKLSEPVFLLTYLKYATQNMRAASAGGVQSFVSLGFLRKYPFPLPPLAEQRRIVKKVEEVIDLINRLKKVMEI